MLWRHGRRLLPGGYKGHSRMVTGGPEVQPSERYEPWMTTHRSYWADAPLGPLQTINIAVTSFWFVSNFLSYKCFHVALVWNQERGGGEGERRRVERRRVEEGERGEMRGRGALKRSWEDNHALLPHIPLVLAAAERRIGKSRQEVTRSLKNCSRVIGSNWASPLSQVIPL